MTNPTERNTMESTVQKQTETTLAGRPAPSGLALKLCEVMGLVDEVPKRGWNDFHKYQYATESDITAAVRSALAERHVLVLPRLENVEWGETPRRNGGTDRLCTTRVAFDFTDADSGEVITVVMVGQGSDSGDKSFYKSISGALKYALLKTFLMSTGNDDPEHEGPADRASSAQRASSSRAPAPPRSHGGASGKDAADQVGPWKPKRPGEPGGPEPKSAEPSSAPTLGDIMAMMKAAKTEVALQQASEFAKKLTDKKDQAALRKVFVEQRERIRKTDPKQPGGDQ